MYFGSFIAKPIEGCNVTNLIRVKEEVKITQRLKIECGRSKHRVFSTLQEAQKCPRLRLLLGAIQTFKNGCGALVERSLLPPKIHSSNPTNMKIFDGHKWSAR